MKLKSWMFGRTWWTIYQRKIIVGRWFTVLQPSFLIKNFPWNEKRQQRLLFSNFKWSNRGSINGVKAVHVVVSHHQIGWSSHMASRRRWVPSPSVVYSLFSVFTHTRAACGVRACALPYIRHAWGSRKCVNQKSTIDDVLVLVPILDCPLQQLGSWGGPQAS